MKCQIDKLLDPGKFTCENESELTMEIMLEDGGMYIIVELCQVHAAAFLKELRDSGLDTVIEDTRERKAGHA